MVNSSQCRKHGFALEEETATYSSILAWKIPRGFLDGSAGKESACNAGDAGDVGLIPGSGRSPGGGHGNSLQYSSLENSMDRGAWQATVHGVARVGHKFVTKPPPIPWGLIGGCLPHPPSLSTRPSLKQADVRAGHEQREKHPDLNLQHVHLWRHFKRACSI